MSQPTTEPRPTRKRPLLRIALALLLLVILVVALAPTLLSLGPAANVARNAIAGSVQGDVALQRVRLGWFSGQAVEGLSIRDASGRNSLDVDVTVHNGLLSLAMGNAVDATLSGKAAGTIEPDGSTGFAKLLSKPEGSSTTPTAPSGQGSASTSPSGLPKGIVANLTIERFAVTIDDVARKGTYAIKDLQGTASIDGDRGTAKTDLRAATDFLGAVGSLSLVADANNLGGATLDLGKVGFDLAFAATNLRVPAGDRTADFSTVDAKIASPSLGQSVTLDASAEGTLDGTTPSSLRAALALDAPVVGGAFAVDPGKARGTVEAVNLPTSLGQPFLAGTDVVLSEDVGPAIERFTLKAPGGGNEPISIDLKTERITLAATARVGADGGVRDGEFDGTVVASPATVRRLGNATIDAPARFVLRGRELAWQPPAGDLPPWTNVVGQIEVVPDAAVVWRDPGKGYVVALGSGGAIRVDRRGASSPFGLDAALALGFAGPGEVASAPSAPNLTAKGALTPDFKRLTQGALDFAATFDPKFLAAATGKTFVAPLPVKVNVSRLEAAVPPAGAEDLSIEARIEIPGQSGLYVQELSREVRFGDLVATIAGREPAKEVLLDLKARVDAGTIALNQTLRGLPKDFTGLDPFGLDLRGTADVQGLDGAAIVAWVPAQRALIESAGIRGLSLALRNEPVSGRAAQRIAVTLGGEPIRGDVAAVVAKTEATIERLDLAGSIGQELVTALQGESENKVKVAKAVPFTASLPSPARFVYADLGDGRLPAGLAARIGVPELVVREAPGLESPLVLRDFDATIAVSSPEQASVKGAMTAVGTTSPSDRIERAEFDLGWRKSTGRTLLSGLTGTIGLVGVHVPWVEALLGQPKGRLSTWTGDDGKLSIAMAAAAGRETIRIEPAFPRLTGTVEVAAQGDALVAKATDINTRVRAVELRQFVNAPDAPAGSSRYDFENFLAVRVPSVTLDAPSALREGGWSLAGAKLDATLATDAVGAQIVAGPGTGKKMTIPAVDATLTSARLDDRLAFSVRNRGDAGGGVIAVDGAIRTLLDANGRPDAAAATVDLDADVKALPTVVLDLLAATGGTIARSLGDTVELSAKARNASKTDGALSFAAKAPYAELSAPAIDLKNGVVTVQAAKPITASFEMSPGVRDELLYLVNPVFSDIGIVKRRATFAMPNLAYPLDGDMRKFNGDFSLDVGEVAFRKAQQFSTVLSLLRRRPTSDETDGLILPLAVQVRDGILTYNDFGVRLGRVPPSSPGAQPTWETSMDFRGEIDLTREPPYAKSITTSLPASQIGSFSGDARRFFEQIPGGADGELARTLSVGITLSGPLFDAEGNIAKLDQRVTLPTFEDMAKDAAKDPGKLLEQGVKIFEQIQKQKK